MSKYVENWWVEELPNGVIHLLINCTERGVYFHAMSDYEFLIAGTEEEAMDSFKECSLSLEPFLPEGTWLWLQTVMLEKDQLSFYYIPYERGWNRNRKIIKESSL